MHRSPTLFFTCAALLWSSICFAAPGELGDNGGNNDNPHNLSSLSPAGKAVQANTETQICIFCHTPHGASPKSTLWGRPNPTGPLGGFPTLTTISLGIDDPVVGGFNTTHYGDTTSGYEYPNGTSKLCLSCHDGVTAIGTLATGDSIDMTISTLDTRTSQIDLSRSHPISFIYNTTVEAYLDTLRSNSYIVPAAGSGYLETDSAGVTRVQCTSCHQPHQDTKGTAGGIYPFWRAGGGLAADYNTVCNACHTAPPSTGGTGHTGYP